MPFPFHPPWLHHSNYTWWREQVMKLLIMQFSPTSLHFFPFLVQIFSSVPCSQAPSVYNVVSIVSKTSVAIWSKTNFGHTGHYHKRMQYPQIFCHFLNASWKSCSVCVQNCMWICLVHLTCVKMAAFLFYLQSGPSQASRVGGGWQSCCFWSKIP
jgi:hypothetical protein